MDDHATLCWRVERACAAAWPARTTDVLNGWAVARSGGGTRRINSASPLSPGATLDPPGLAAIVAAYRDAGLPAIVRLPTLIDPPTRALDDAGFAAAEGASTTLALVPGAMPAPPAMRATRIAIDPAPTPAWRAARRRLSLVAGAGAEDHLEPLARLRAPAWFASAAIDGATRAVAFAALTDGIAIIEAVATDPDWRGRGLAGACVAALVDRATVAGAVRIALQVARDNAAALALYRRLGFTCQLYDYGYRRRG